jgi:hypothetical protein
MILQEIFDSDKKIYFLSGDKKYEAITMFDSEYMDIMKITRNMITFNEDIDNYLSKITVKQLITKAFIMELSEFNLTTDSELKSFLHNEYASLAYNFLNMVPDCSPNKLFVHIDNKDDIRDLSKSILERSQFINVDNKI